MGKIRSMLGRGLRYVVRGVPRVNTTARISLLSPEGKLQGKRIIVTGGGRGLGLAMARKFVAEGAQVLISGRNEQNLKEQAQQLGCQWLRLDVTDVATFDAFLAEADGKLGGVNCLVNNAGISLHEADFTQVTPEGFDRQIATNLRGGFFLTQKFVQLLLSRQQQGTVLFTSSETGDTADLRPYGWTKAAINSMVRGMAYRLAPQGFRINAVAPGVTASDMTGFNADDDITYEANLSGRVYLPEEVAETACFLLSDAAGCLNGQILVCNNGNTINARWK